jgi:DNA repair exonuclease SbcCD ATPase subunit
MGLFKKQISIDPKDFLALRAELVDLRARLEESEQARALVESRLSALDASTTALAAMPAAQGGLASPSIDLAEMSGRIEQLESQMHETRIQGTAPQPSVGPSTLELNAKIDALHNRVIAQTDVSGRLTDLEEQVSTVNGRIAEVADLAQRPAAPAGAPLMAPPPLPSGPDPDTVARIEAITARLAEVDSLTQQFAELSQQVSSTSSLAGEVDALRQQVSSAPPTDPGEPGAAAPDPEMLARLDALSERVADIDSLSERVAEIGSLSERVAEIDALRSRLADVDALAEQVTQMQSASADPQEPSAFVDPAITDELREQIGMLAERVAATDTEARATREQLSVLDQRVSSIGTELANQISELGRDIDSLAEHTPAEVAGGGVNDQVITALRESQVRLAAEQARYEIAFREDLAALAEQLRKPLGS